jgi:hypothetical protein
VDGELGNCTGFNCAIAYGHDAMVNHQQFRDTIWHEIKHALFYESGLATEIKDPEIKLDEESIVRRLATLEMAVMWENPSLMRWLLRKPKNAQG